MKCAIIDDDSFARKSLRLLCDNVDDLQVVAEFSSALEAVQGLKNLHEIDVLLLDIHMPELTGFEYLNTLTKPPKVIFTTSDTGKATDAFDIDAIDYLVKPVELPRFLKAVSRLRSRLNPSEVKIGEKIAEGDQQIWVNIDKRLKRLEVKEICVVEAKGDYVLVKLEDGENHIVRSTMKKIEDRLPTSIFVKVHRSFLVNVEKIVDIEDASILINNQVIPISRKQLPVLLSRLNTL